MDDFLNKGSKSQNNGGSDETVNAKPVNLDNYGAHKGVGMT